MATNQLTPALQPIADALLAAWSARMTAWNAMTPAQQTAAIASGNGAPDPDYPQNVYDLAREYASELADSGAVTEAEIVAAAAAGNANAVVVAYNQNAANTAAAAAGVAPTTAVSLSPNAVFVPVVIPYTRGPTESTEGASLPVGYAILPGETQQEAMARRYRELYGTSPPAPPSPTAVSPPDNITHGGSLGMRPPPALGVNLARDTETFGPADGVAGPAGQSGADMATGNGNGGAFNVKQLAGVGVALVLVVVVVLVMLARRSA